MSTTKTEHEVKTPRICGLIMPISAMDGIPASHWQEVKSIVAEALPDWQVQLVSDGEDAGVIQRRIIERLYNDEMVIADVSARNPNVMFELGMRLAFDKPTVIIKDDLTVYPFDVGPNEYVDYPRDLRFAKIVSFQKRLAEKVLNTLKAEHTTFLRSFGSFKVAKIDTKEVGAEALIVDRLEQVQSSVERLIVREREREQREGRDLPLLPLPQRRIGGALDVLSKEHHFVQLARIRKVLGIAKDVDDDGMPAFLLANLGPDASPSEIRQMYKTLKAADGKPT